MTKKYFITSVIIGALLSACHSGGVDLIGHAPTVDTGGPHITWDPFAEPLPEIPFPNNVGTRPDRKSPTGLRINASMIAPTEFEQDLRTKLAGLDGFGTSAPMWIQFESPDPSQPDIAKLDLAAIAAAQTGDINFSDDMVLLINVSPESPTYGEASVLDFGNGNFPMTLEDTKMFDYDPRPTSSNLIFDVEDEDSDADGVFDVWEDINQNGVLDAGEDVDGDGKLDVHEDSDNDGVFDRGNVWGPDGHTYHDLITFYEQETNTLLFRPVYPLEERTTYAVVITKDLVNEDGKSIVSPFDYVHHLQQKAALKPIFEDGLLTPYGRNADDVAFAWTFTTQSVTYDLVRIREGLRGYGPLAHLSSDYPAEILSLETMNSLSGVAAYHLTPEKLVGAIRVLFDNLEIANYESSRINELVDTYGAVDYMVAGDYRSVDFLDAGGGSFQMEAEQGIATTEESSLRFIMVVPKKEYAQNGKPFPVAFYCHGHTSLKVEALAFAGVLAKFGIATFAIDAPGHGIPIGGPYDVIVEGLLAQLAGDDLIPFYNALKKDRAKDLNNDSIYEPGGDFFTNDSFHTRDIVRQTNVDYVQAARTLQTFDGVRTWAIDLNGDGIANDIAGDFDGDGQVDLGGADVDYFALGTSMGGINSTILATIEPTIVAAAPMAPGGSLLEVGMRTELGNVVHTALMPMLGPMLIAEPKGNDAQCENDTACLYNLKWLVNDVFTHKLLAFATVGEIVDGEVVNELRPGDIIKLYNLKSGEMDQVQVHADRTFRIHLASDKYDPVRVTVERPDGSIYRTVDTFEYDVNGFQGDDFLKETPLLSVQQGFGHRRNTPSLRRLLGLGQIILEPGDPINYAPRYRDPLDIMPEGKVPTNLLLVLTAGDFTVPISAGVALGRAAGIIGYKEIDERYGKSQNQLLIDTHVMESVDKLKYFETSDCYYDNRSINFDIDDVSNGLHWDDPPRLGKIARAPECDGDNPPASCTNECPVLPPLRAVLETESGTHAVRIPMLKSRGQHALDLPDSTVVFDPSTFTFNQIGHYLINQGQMISDHPCLATNDCSTCAGEADCPQIPKASYLDSGL